MTNPSDTLRRAAEIIRERAAAATPGPWQKVGEAVYDYDRCMHEYALETADKFPVVWPQYLLDQAARFEVELPGKMVEQPVADLFTDNEANADWIALMSPELAQPLIDWLQSQADEMETLTSWNGYWTALDLARAIVEKVDG